MLSKANTCTCICAISPPVGKACTQRVKKIWKEFNDIEGEIAELKALFSKVTEEGTSHFFEFDRD